MPIDPAIVKVLDVLSNERRIDIVFSLYKAPPNGELAIEDIAERQRLPADRFLVTAHHHHLPRLAEIGLIDWDRKRRCVSRGSSFEDVVPLIEVIEEHWVDSPSNIF